MLGIKSNRTPVLKVFFALIGFFPLGFIFLHRRLTEDKSESVKNSKVVKIYGWILTAIGVLYVILGIYGESRIETESGQSIMHIMFYVSLFFYIPGSLLIRGAKKMRILGERYDKYYQIINRGVTSIQDIADEMKITAAVVSRDLPVMIDSYFLPGTYVDFTLGEVILPGRINKSTNKTEKQGRSKAISCRNCGANCVVVEGIASQCEYCGSIITY